MHAVLGEVGLEADPDLRGLAGHSETDHPRRADDHIAGGGRAPPIEGGERGRPEERTEGDEVAPTALLVHAGEHHPRVVEKEHLGELGVARHEGAELHPRGPRRHPDDHALGGRVSRSVGQVPEPEDDHHDGEGDAEQGVLEQEPDQDTEDGAAIPVPSPAGGPVIADAIPEGLAATRARECLPHQTRPGERRAQRRTRGASGASLGLSPSRAGRASASTSPTAERPARKWSRLSA